MSASATTSGVGLTRTNLNFPALAGSTKALPRTRVAIVVPCFNEEEVIPHLGGTLTSVRETLADRFDVQFIFVDDGSADRTWELLCRHFPSSRDSVLARHERNQGLTAAILTGMRQADCDIVCTMDCDCTYDPHELGNMIPLLTGDVDLVTASPYHPRGLVRNVPRWRLSLSKTSSFLYRCVLRQKLFTYTSCFRVYRKSALANLPITSQGFQGIAEILGLMDLQGSKIVEYPAVLNVRQFGQSKMKILRTITGHFKLLTRLLALRLSRKGVSPR